VAGDDGIGNKDNNGDSQSLSASQGAPSPPKPPESPRGNQGTKDEQQPPSRFWRIVKEVFEVVSFVAVIATMIFVGLQWREMGRQYAVMAKQLAEMHTTGQDTHTLAQQTTTLAEQTKSLAGSAKTAADAAKTSANNSDRIARGSEAAVKTAQASMRLDQRAWIGIKGVRDLHLEIGHAPSLTVVFINTGKTPAIKATISSYIEYVPPHERAAENVPGSVDEASNTTISPGEEQWSVLNKSQLVLTSAIADAIALRTGNLYVRSVITYDDIFARHHSTHYCGVASRDLSSIGSCADGNYSD
jgi:hypothetical protein